ncbi:hypothetical protein AVEN_267713-1 [Araneus ventricosus]|uniref:Uncharacterized protein n=1 Tax=Araneus ventricosus TaxID=182803 RepID=A0A4Y2CVB6_ARAVE|nr:hypothetical protein AVEN_267713-1 [Araneus ventricosus]
MTSYRRKDISPVESGLEPSSRGFYPVAFLRYFRRKGGHISISLRGKPVNGWMNGGTYLPPFFSTLIRASSSLSFQSIQPIQSELFV